MFSTVVPLASGIDEGEEKSPLSLPEIASIRFLHRLDRGAESPSDLELSCLRYPALHVKTSSPVV